ncbi:hypothetical protein B0A55_00928 [Friedmanniomyces simplex]|uniref:Uncharacterized protein n=1 Tax=Friedmanniomyces simplex TaxID=329884 RepID=A0A4U0Y3M0_9PEZI|nr:hypothetical protein B0A55_00928 [Friedmanniomyces simplex]
MASLTLTFVERPPEPLTFTAGTVPLTTVFSPLPTCTSGPWSDGELLPFGLRGRRGGTVLAGRLSERVYGGRELDDRRQQCHDFDLCPFGMAYLQLASSCEATLGNTYASNEAPTMVVSNRTVQYSNAFTAFASTIAVAWALTDLDRYTPASAPTYTTELTAATGGSNFAESAASNSATSTSATLSSASAPSPTQSGSSPPSPTQTNTSLSVGAKAGIGVGASLGGLALVALGVWLLLRRRKSHAGGEVNYVDGKAELPGEGAGKQSPKAGELSTRGEIHEFRGDGRPAELGLDVRHFTSAIAAAVLAFASVQVLAAPLPQLAGEGAAANSILSSTDNGVGFGIENAEDNLAGNVATLKADGVPAKRQLAGEGAAADSILSSTDNGVGYGTENAEDGLATLVTSVKGGAAAKRQLDKIANGAQTLSNAAGTGASTSSLTTALVGIDGSSTSGAANIGADVGTLEESTLESAGSAVPKTRRQADKICNGASTLSDAAGTGALTSSITTSCVGIDGDTTSGAANTGAALGTAEESTLEDAGSAVPKA